MKILKNKKIFVDIIILTLVFFLILSFIDIKYILMKTITSGGDMASDYYPAKYMKDYLMPKFKFVGWAPGWYGGMPMFQFYFFPCFFLMFIMSYIIPLEIAFKIVTLMGTFLLPLMTYFCFKFMKFKFPLPIIAAILILPFLFMEANSMWGGNIPSTLAGEFSYSFSFSLVILYLGTFYKGIKENKHWILNSVIFTLIVLTHIIPGIFAVLCTGFFLVKELLNKENFIKNFIYVFKTYLIAFLLLSFWSLPFIMNMKYTTTYADFWKVSFNEIFPLPLNIFLGLTILTVVTGLIKKEEKILYLGFSVLCAIFLFYIAEPIHLVNIRFAPFFQCLVMIIPVSLFSIKFKKIKIDKKFKLLWILPLIIFFIIAWFLQENVGFIPHWIKWNYEGFEEKSTWFDYKEINDFLKGDQSDPRVVYEHSSKHNQYGTSRAFESLPLFSGRSTLEGLFMQSSISSPYIFYIQSEISKENSCPFWRTFPCTQRNFTMGTKHLEMFNVKDFIAISDEVKEELKNYTQYKLVKESGDLSIYELTTNKNNYVYVPDYQPVAYSGDWKKFFYEWFEKEEYLDVPIIYTKDDSFNYQKITELKDIEKVSTKNNCNIQEEIMNEEIFFKTDCIGAPHIVKVSYHPNWKVKGAEKVYLVSPSFMLIIPNDENVTLYYGSGFWEIFGKILTFIGILFLIIYTLLNNHKFIRFLKR